MRENSPPTTAGPSLKEATLPVEVGQMAPDFTLAANNGERVQLSAFRGSKRVVLAFFVLAFTGG